MNLSSQGMWQAKRSTIFNSKSATARRQKSILEVLYRSWWVLLFWAICFFLYSQAMQKKSKVCIDLKNKIEELETFKQGALEEREDLVLQIDSQNDNAWVEMILKKRLGVVAEGQMKVYFKKDE